MTHILAKPFARDVGAAAPKKAAAKAAAVKILAIVDGSASTGRVLKYLLELPGNRQAIEVILLNIQPKPQEWRTRGYGWFQREAIRDRLINDLGKRVVASAAQRLDSAGIANHAYIEIGEAADTILRRAGDENCDLIVMAEPPPGLLRRWLMQQSGIAIGSVASVLIHLAPVPVVVAR
jgi:nucleotide-binding universal stress UspA family protein